MTEHLYNTAQRITALCCLVLSFNQLAAQAPVANFSASPLSGCSPLVVNFQDLSTGNPTSWSWNFGNSNTSTLQHPTATYFTPGTYTVTLTATNAGGSNTITRTQYITVYEPPVVNFSASVTSGCFPLYVQFTDLSTPGAGNTNTAWLWDFGNGMTSSLQNPQAVYNTAGAFTVTLRVTNDKGCVRTFTRPNYINVTNGVTAGFTHTPPQVCNPPADISFTNTSTGPATLSYLWNFGDGNTSTLQNPTHTYTTAGSFIVTLVTTSTAGCQDTVVNSPIVIGGYSTAFTIPPITCFNIPVVFTNTSSPAPVTASWTFGDGGTANSISATHSYSSPGTYTVWLYNTYSNCTDSVSQTITINPRPSADFTAPVTSRCEPPLTVNFQDLSAGGAVAWQWDFGDGNTSTLQHPSHTYTAYDTFTVTLIATNASGCTDTIVRPGFVIISRADITIPAFPASGCIPYTIHPVPVVNAVDAVTSWQWDFGDGATSTLQFPSHTYSAQGTYTVSLIITTSTGCTDTLVLPGAVRVGTKPVADFSAMPIPVCAREPIHFTDLSAPADEWFWEFGDGGTSTLQNPTYQYSDTGFFTVTLVAYNNGCPDTVVKTDYVYVLPPVAQYGVAPDCSNRLRFTFSDQSIAPLTWEWDFGDGSPFSTVQNPVHIYPALGTYTVRLVVTNGGCTDTMFRQVHAVSEIPDFNADILTACHDATITFTGAGMNPANITGYTWNFGDGTILGTAIPEAVHVYTTAGLYNVSLSVTDINGCNDITVKTAYIRIYGPEADFTATNVAGCTGLVTTFNDFSTTDGVSPIVNWQWHFGDGVVQNFSGPPFTHTYNNPGLFSVKLVITDANGCKDSLRIPDLVRTTDPVPNFTASVNLSCPNYPIAFTNTSTATGFSSVWYFGDGATSTATSPAHAYTNPGVYDVKLVIVDVVGCADSVTKTAYIRVETPTAGFSVNDSISSCLPFEVQFTNTSLNYAVSAWDFGPGEGNSTINNPVHYYAVPGIFPVQLIVTNPGGCADTIVKNIQVYDTIGAVLHYTPVNGCKPLTLSFNAFSPGLMASYFWDFGDGNTMTSTTPLVSHTYLSYGTFFPSVIMEDPTGCLIPLRGLDTIRLSGADADFAIDTGFFCDAGTVTFSDSTEFNDPIALYNWDFGDGTTSTAQNPVHLYSSPGIYTVQLVVQTQNGCRDTMQKPAIIKVVQRPLTDIGGDSVICINESITHTGIFIQPDTSVVTWQWTFPNGNSSTQQNPPAQAYNTAGTFTVTSIATNSSGCRDTVQQTIIVHPLPTVTMPGQLTVQAGFPVTIPAVYSPNTVNWIWSPAAGLSCGNCPNPETDPDFNTRYQVYFTDDNGCSNLGEINVVVICKNANLFLPNTFSPNRDGSNDIFYPRGRGIERVRFLRIFNRWGEVVFEKRDFPVNVASAGWDGTYKGQRPQADVYVYQVEVFCDNGEIIRLNGNIALIL